MNQFDNYSLQYSSTSILDNKKEPKWGHTGLVDTSMLGGIFIPSYYDEELPKASYAISDGVITQEDLKPSIINGNIIIKSGKIFKGNLYTIFGINSNSKILNPHSATTIIYGKINLELIPEIAIFQRKNNEITKYKNYAFYPIDEYFWTSEYNLFTIIYNADDNTTIIKTNDLTFPILSIQELTIPVYHYSEHSVFVLPYFPVIINNIHNNLSDIYINLQYGIIVVKRQQAQEITVTFDVTPIAIFQHQSIPQSYLKQQNSDNFNNRYIGVKFINPAIYADLSVLPGFISYQQYNTIKDIMFGSLQ